jgi:hypothetical protein
VLFVEMTTDFTIANALPDCDGSPQFGPGHDLAY